MAWSSEDIPDQRERVAVVTGANSGLGLEVSRQLARKGARVLMAARDHQRGKAACDAISAEVDGAELEVRALDLSCLDSVRACAEGIAADHGRVDLLINNAGVMATPEETTADGFERQLGVNHLGHFVLTRRLLPTLAAAPAARVVSVTSFARLASPTVRPANPHLRGTYNTWWAYGQSKLANLQFALELHRRLKRAQSTVQSLVAHPGLAKTELQTRSVRETGGLGSRFWQLTANLTGMPATRGALPLLRAATDPRARGGQLYGPLGGTVGPAVRRPVISPSAGPSACRRLWEVSERETGERFDIGEILG